MSQQFFRQLRQIELVNPVVGVEGGLGVVETPLSPSPVEGAWAVGGKVKVENFECKAVYGGKLSVREYEP
jgi:hypothetical protein